jgi:hypothetical protein
VVLGCIVVKAPRAAGNRSVLHFGQDGNGQHHGTVYLAFNTIVTPYIAPVVELSASGAKANLVGNVVSDGGIRQNNQVVGNVRGGASLANLTGCCNWFSGGFSPAAGIGLDPQTNLFRRTDQPLFVAPEKDDYRLREEFVRAAVTRPACRHPDLPLPPGLEQTAADPPLAWQYRHPAGKESRPPATAPIQGAFGASVR